MKKNKNAFFALLVLLYICFGGSVGICPDFGEDALTVSVQDQDWTVPYSQIRSLELTEHTDYGTLIDGQETKTLCFGTYENDLWGRYTLCIDPRIGRSIVVTLDERIFVFNYESSDSTGQLYEMFLQLYRSKAS